MGCQRRYLHGGENGGLVRLFRSSAACPPSWRQRKTEGGGATARYHDACLHDACTILETETSKKVVDAVPLKTKYSWILPLTRRWGGKCANSASMWLLAKVAF